MRFSKKQTKTHSDQSRSRKARRKRLLQTERLEPRHLLSGSPNPSYNDVSPAWFAQADEVSNNPSQLWVARFKSEALGGIDSALGAERLLTNSPVSFEVVRGLGLPGQVLLATSETDAAAVAIALSGNPNIAYFEPNQTIVSQATPNDPDYTKQ